MKTTRDIKKRVGLFSALALINFSISAWSNGAGTSSGLTLLRNSGARSSAMGEAFVSMTNDITAMDFNVAALASMESGQASLHYEKGYFDDSFSKAMVGFGSPSMGVFGLSTGYYNSGKVTLFDGVNAQKSVIAQQDLAASLGYGFRIQSFNFGAGIKYLQSELAETSKGTAVSAEVGLQYQILSNLRIGASGPVYQSELKYANENENLPKVYRAGLGMDFKLPLATGEVPLKLLFDVPYYANEHETATALGAETRFGALALRAGTNTRSDVQQFTMGAGFQFHQTDLDYSFGLTNNGNYDAVHKVNFSIRFNDFRNSPAEVKSPKQYDVRILSADLTQSMIDPQK